LPMMDARDTDGFSGANELHSGAIAARRGSNILIDEVMLFICRFASFISRGQLIMSKRTLMFPDDID